MHAVHKENLKCIAVIIGCCLAHPHTHVPDRELCTGLVQSSLYIFVRVSNGIVQRIPAETILCSNIGTMLEQQLHHPKMPLTRCKVNGSPSIIVSLHRIHAILYQPQHRSLVPDAGSLTKLDTSLGAWQLYLVHEIFDVDLGLLFDPTVHLLFLESLRGGGRGVRVPHANECRRLVVLFPHCVVQGSVLKCVLHSWVSIHCEKQPASLCVSI
mmetsp:Transcript_32981/g.84527  ORF Transcript_32981/g.84527 Transcript_32981/m.84527 type:complete len:212 (-) Transcript_32981:8324-8959(-)